MTVAHSPQDLSYPCQQARTHVAVVIDGGHGLRNTMVRDLVREGWSVHACDNSRDGLELARQHQPALVVIDLQQNVLFSEALLESLNAATPSSRKVVVTDTALGSNMVRALCAGADDLFTRPVTLKAVIGWAGNVSTGGSNPADGHFWSLERAKWEHIKYVMSRSSSFAEAARRLALQPRSLRRMLQKTPPPR